MNVLLTGGSGFIGRNIVEQMSSRYNILAPSHAELELFDEVKVRNYLTQNKINIVIHSATKPGHRNSSDTSNLLKANTRMFFNLARNSHLYKKMIFLSSGAVYDAKHYQPKMTEAYFGKHIPLDDHGFSKYICAKYIERADNIVELRIFGVFGKYEDYAIRFISNAICKAIFDLPITCRQNRIFDYLWINDLMPVLDYFIENDSANKAFNVTPDESIGLLSLAKEVLKVSGKGLPILVANDGFGDEYSGYNSLLKEEMPQLSFTPIDEAIRQLYDWYKDNQQLIDKKLLLVDK